MIQVEYNNLESGKIYYIETLEDYGSNAKHYGTFKEYTINNTGFTVAIFNNIKNVPNSRSHVSERCGDGYRNSAWRFYECKKFYIYRNMERRALCNILVNVIGNESFVDYLDKNQYI